MPQSKLYTEYQAILSEINGFIKEVCQPSRGITNGICDSCKDMKSCKLLGAMLKAIIFQINVPREG